MIMQTSTGRLINLSYDICGTYLDWTIDDAIEN